MRQNIAFTHEVGPIEDPSADFSALSAFDGTRAFILKVGARLRHYRKARDMTLSRLADAIGTTPQTIQRLETGKMTLSLDWISRICFVLDIEPAVLFDTRDANAIPVIGTLGRSNEVQSVRSCEQSLVTFGGFPRDRIAVRLSSGIANYMQGDILVAMRMDHHTDVSGNWGHCLVGVHTDTLRLMHVARDRLGQWILVPPDRDQNVEFATEIRSLAQIVCVVRNVATTYDCIPT